MLPVVSEAQTRTIKLPQADCGALPHGATGCTMTAVTRLIGKSADSSVFYFDGYLQACAVTEPGGCSTKNWWVKDYFKFTQLQSGTPTDVRRAWDYGTPSCSAHGTNIKWCSYVGNGTTHFQEGFNFGNGGWTRMNIVGDTGLCTLSGPSWTHPDGYTISEQTGPAGECI
jgi:hypothetical protein